MATGKPRSEHPARRWLAAIALIYLFVALLWLHGSDASLDGLYQDHPLIQAYAGSLKGALLLVLTAMVVFMLLRMRRGDARLRESEAQYRLMFQSNPHPMWVFDVETHRFLAVNDAAVLQYGYTEPELLQMQVADLHLEADRGRVLAFLAEHSGQSMRQSGPWRQLRKDGTSIDVAIASHRIQFDGRQARLVLASDLTEITAARRRIERQRDLYDLLSRCNEAMVRAVDRQELLDSVVRLAVENGGFKFAWIGGASDAGVITPLAKFGEDFGYVSTLRLSFDPSDPQGRGPTGEAIRTGQPVRVQDFLTDPRTVPWQDDARRRGIGASAAYPIVIEGRVAAAMMLYASEAGYFDDDISATLEQMAADVAYALDSLRTRHELADANRLLEQKVAERTREAMEARVRAESADRAKTMFLTSMSHELRSPLNSIIGFTSVLLEGFDGALSPLQHEHLRIISEASYHLLAIINDLLDMSTIEAGAVVLEARPFPISRPLERILRRFSLQARQKGLELRSEGPASEIELVGDERRVEQVVANFVSNAIKYTASGAVTLAWQGENDRLRIDVRDTGPGIAEEDRGQLFKRFAQLTPGTVPEGTGLGLAIAAGLAEAMGGQIVLQSQVGAGSTFSVFLPIRQPRE